MEAHALTMAPVDTHAHAWPDTGETFAITSHKDHHRHQRHAIRAHAKTMDNAQTTTMVATCAHVKRDTREKTAKHPCHAISVRISAKTVAHA